MWLSAALLGTGLFLQKNRFADSASSLMVTGSMVWIWAAVNVSLKVSGGFNLASILLSLSFALLALHLLSQRFKAPLLGQFAFLLPAWAVVGTFWDLQMGNKLLEWNVLFAWLTYFVVQHLMLSTSQLARDIKQTLYVLVSYLLFARLMFIFGALLGLSNLHTYAWVLVPLGYYWVHLLLWKKLPFTP